jgi:hypothetical protein
LFKNAQNQVGWGCTLVILATWEAEARISQIRGQLRQKQNTNKSAEGMAHHGKLAQHV